MSERQRKGTPKMALQPPYGAIAELLQAGMVVPFLGAGATVGGRPPQAAWEGRNSRFPPTGAELTRHLARLSNFPYTSEHELADLAKVASYYAATIARVRLRQSLREIFDNDYAPCAIHTYLAGVPVPLLIVTTNYDDLLEQAFQKAGRPYDLVVHPTDQKDVAASVLWWPHGAVEPTAVRPNSLYVDLDTTTVIYKLHGTVNRANGKWDSFVITEEDYVEFLWRMTGRHGAVPPLLVNHFLSRHFLFLGYGLVDWNLRLLLRYLRGTLPKPRRRAADDEAPNLRSWAIQRDPTDLERELWNARGVKIFSVDLDEFTEHLRLAQVG